MKAQMDELKDKRRNKNDMFAKDQSLRRRLDHNSVLAKMMRENDIEDIKYIGKMSMHLPNDGKN